MLVLLLRNKGIIMIALGLLFLCAPELTYSWLELQQAEGASVFLQLLGLLSIAMGSSIAIFATVFYLQRRAAVVV